jgi:hypothetical protein
MKICLVLHSLYPYVFHYLCYITFPPVVTVQEYPIFRSIYWLTQTARYLLHCVFYSFSLIALYLAMSQWDSQWKSWESSVQEKWSSWSAPDDMATINEFLV